MAYEASVSNASQSEPPATLWYCPALLCLAVDECNMNMQMHVAWRGGNEVTKGIDFDRQRRMETHENKRNEWKDANDIKRIERQKFSGNIQWRKEHITKVVIPGYSWLSSETRMNEPGWTGYLWWVSHTLYSCPRQAVVWCLCNERLSGRLSFANEQSLVQSPSATRSGPSEVFEKRYPSWLAVVLSLRPQHVYWPLRNWPRGQLVATDPLLRPPPRKTWLALQQPRLLSSNPSHT